MKNFFKKLSFVLALAMIVTAIAPAAGAFAASAPALSAKGTKYLYLGNETKSSLDLNVTNKPAGASYVWSSSKKTVATVNKYGIVKGVKQGKTTVSLAITKKDGSKTTLSVDFVVRNNIKSFTSIVDADGADLTKLEAGKAYDLNGKFITNGGSTTSTSSVARWSVDSDKATIDVKTGLFTANEAGTFKVTVRAFETATGADAWVALNDATSTAGVKASGTFEVTVVADIVSTKQVDTDTFEVTFNADMSKTDLSATTAVVAQIINGKEVVTGTEKIKSLKLDATGKVATVDLYAAVKAKTEYTFTYKELVGKFTAASVSLADVASVDFADSKFVLGGTATELKNSVVGKNKDGVVIYEAKTDTDFANALTFSYTGDLSKGYLSGSTIYLYEEGYVAPVKVEFNHYAYNAETKVYDHITSNDTAVVVCVKTDASLDTASIQYAVLPGGSAPDDKTVWSPTSVKIAAGDSGYSFWVRYLNKDAENATDYETPDNGTKFDFESTRPEIALVTGQYIYPITAGTVSVLVKDKTNPSNVVVVGSFDVTVLPTRALNTVTIDNKYLTVNNNTTHGNKGDATDKVLATIVSTDTMGAPRAVTVNNDLTALRVPRTGAVAPTLVIAPDGVGKYTIKVNATNTPTVDAGAYTYKLNITDGTTTRTEFVTVVVVDGQTNVAVTSWRLELSDTSLDLKDVTTAKTVSMVMAGYNSNNVKVDVLATSNYTLEISKNGTAVANAGTAVYTQTAFKAVTVTGSAITPVAEGTGTYLVTVKNIKGAGNPITKETGTVIGSATFALNDTTARSFIVDSPVVDHGTVKDMLKAAFSFTINGTKVTDALEANITGVKYTIAGTSSTDLTTLNAAISAGISIYVTEITYEVTNTQDTLSTADDTVTVHKFAPKAIIKAK